MRFKISPGCACFLVSNFEKTNSSLILTSNFPPSDGIRLIFEIIASNAFNNSPAKLTARGLYRQTTQYSIEISKDDITNLRK